MSQPTTPPDGGVPPMPYPGTTATGPSSSPEGTVPPMPSEVPNGRAREAGTGGRFRAAMAPLRKMMRRPT